MNIDSASYEYFTWLDRQKYGWMDGQTESQDEANC